MIPHLKYQKYICLEPEAQGGGTIFMSNSMGNKTLKSLHETQIERLR